MLVIHVPASARITVGALGEFLFKPGYYIYVGSAQGGLDQRVSRHLKQDKNLHWHIDYLLQHATVVDTMLFETPDHESEQNLRRRLQDMLSASETAAGPHGLDHMPTECLLAQSVSSQNGASEPVRGFGSSDCRCPAHLFYLSDLSTLQFTNSTH